jgi:hypothetical protein
MNDAAIHRVSGEVFDLSLRFLVHSGSPRPQGARDDNRLCHCEEGAGVTDAAIHRVSKDAGGFASSFIEGPVDRHGLRPRDDNTFSHCEEGAERGTRQSIVSRKTQAGLHLRLLGSSGSPRATPSR